MAAVSRKFLFTLFFDGDYSKPETIKFDGNSLDFGNDAKGNAEAVKKLPLVPNPPDTTPPDPDALNRLEQLAFYQDPDANPDPKKESPRVALTGVADLKGLYKLDPDGKSKLIDKDSNIINNDAENGFPTGMAKVVDDFFAPLVRVILNDHRTKGLDSTGPLPHFTWVVIFLKELQNGDGFLETEGMEGISGGGK